MNKKITIVVPIIIAAIVLIGLSGYASASNETKTINNTNVGYRNNDNDWFNYYFMYTYIFNFPPFGYTSAPEIGRYYVMYPTEGQDGWSVRSPEVVKTIEEPSGEIGFEHEAFVEPDYPEGYSPEPGSNDEVAFEQTVQEAESSQASQVSDVPEDYNSADTGSDSSSDMPDSGADTSVDGGED